ncbi:Immunoglobulin omega chain [Sciurus carolinensis]|nr:Immunoglobulin omega chain [Sciurus carolinensis]
MAWTPLLLLLLSHYPGTRSQPVMTQPSSLSASLGTSVILSCTLSGGLSVGIHIVSWFQQKAGSPPQFLLYHHTHSDGYEGSMSPNRFSGSKDTMANAVFLHISQLQSEDEADYYCNTWDGNTRTDTVLQSQEELRQIPLLSSLGLMQLLLLVVLIMLC